MDVDFLNLNELEITVGNHDNMELRGFNLSTEITAGAAGSAELSVSMRDRVMAAQFGIPDPLDGIIREPYGFHLKFCTATYKDSGQLRRRFIRRGEHTIAPHETLTDDGTLIFGAVNCSPSEQSDWIDEITKEIIEDELSSELVFLVYVVLNFKLFSRKYFERLNFKSLFELIIEFKFSSYSAEIFE